MNLKKENCACVSCFLLPEWNSLQLAIPSVVSIMSITSFLSRFCSLPKQKCFFWSHLHWKRRGLIMILVEKVNFSQASAEEVQEDERVSWRPWSNLSFAVWWISRPTLDLEIWPISTYKSPDPKVNFASYSGLSRIRLRLVTGDCKASFALQSNLT